MPRRVSSNSVQIISINRAAILTRLRQIARQIKVRHREVQDVRVFGSIARGDHVGTSDVDILIILVGESTPDLLARIQTFYHYFMLPIGVDLLVYTMSEIQRGNACTKQIYAESKSLLEN